MILLSLESRALPAWIFVAAILVYYIGGLLLKLLDPRPQRKQALTVTDVDTEKGALDRPPRAEAEVEFQLEKRGFFSKVCSPYARLCPLTFSDLAVHMPLESVCQSW